MAVKITGLISHAFLRAGYTRASRQHRRLKLYITENFQGISVKICEKVVQINTRAA